MIVVADTGPLNYLIQIDCAGVLPRLYERILIPPGVIHELRHRAAPDQVRAWVDTLPTWIDVLLSSSVSDVDLADLDRGEREAIQLAEEQRAELLLIDERRGRQRATQRGLKAIGTLGVLLDAGEMGLIDPAAAYRRLLETNFRVSGELGAEFLSQLNRRTDLSI